MTDQDTNKPGQHHNERSNLMRKTITGFALATSFLLAACDRPADVASRNLSVAADNFEINRRVIFYNGITDSYMLTVEGRCALGNRDGGRQKTITCRTGPDSYKKHFLGLSDNVTYFVEQLGGERVSTYHYRVMFRPQIIVPDIDLQADLIELVDPSNGDAR